MCLSLLEIEQDVVVGETTAQFVPMTGWLPVGAWSTVIALIMLTSATSEFRGTPAFQTAIDRNAPDTAVVLESGGGGPTWVSSGAPTDCTDPTAPTVTGKFWIRFGVMAKNVTTQGVVSRAHVSLSLQGY